MNQLLERDLDNVLGRVSARRTGLGCEAPLRVAAATLSGTLSGEVSATTVVGILGQDDVTAVEALVADISEEFGLDSRLRAKVGSFSVRFSRREEY